MACGSYPDAYDLDLYRSFHERLRERVSPGEEFRPLRATSCDAIVPNKDGFI